jgi:Lar family restriction alleviation protein
MEKMKRCPFCGGKPRYVIIDKGENDGGECIECIECQASTSVMFPLMDSVKELLYEKWNRRAT